MKIVIIAISLILLFGTISCYKPQLPPPDDALALKYKIVVCFEHGGYQAQSPFDGKIGSDAWIRTFYTDNYSIHDWYIDGTPVDCILKINSPYWANKSGYAFRGWSEKPFITTRNSGNVEWHITELSQIIREDLREAMER